MKKILLFFSLLCCLTVYSQNDPFVTVWDLSDAGPSPTIVFKSRVVSGQEGTYEWYLHSSTTPSFSSSLHSGDITVGGELPNDIIRLVIFPSNVQRFFFSEAMGENARLIRVEQWGNVAWTSMEDMFLNCANLEITATDTPNLSGVSSLRRMFSGCTSLIGPPNINNWNVSSINNFSEMFSGATSFNQPIGNWIVTNATDMYGMFSNANSFNQNLGSWLFNGATNLSNFLSGSGLDCINYSSTLIGWDANPGTPAGLYIDCAGLEYGTNAEAARQSLLDSGWTINGDTPRSDICIRTGDFITVWDLSRPGLAESSITFNVEFDGVVQYTWEQVNDVSINGLGSFSIPSVTIPGLPDGQTIRLIIDPEYLRRFAINNGSDRLRLVDVTQWGDVAWSSMANAFLGCVNLEVSATDIPYLSLVNNASGMFAGCSSLTGPPNIGNWNVSAINNFSDMFAGAINFNQPIGNWIMSSATNISGMFAFVQSFNQAIENWEVLNVTNMSFMFNGASSFNQDIGNWQMDNVTNTRNMFLGALAFNQYLGNWNVSNVTDMRDMFYDSRAFNFPLGNWNLHQDVLLENMLDYCGLDCLNYSKTLVDWAAKPNPPAGKTLGAVGLEYNSDAAAARASLGWTFVGDSQVVVYLNTVSSSGAIDQEICLGDSIDPILIEFGGEAVGVSVVGILPSGIVQGVSGGYYSLSGTPTNEGSHTIILETIGGCDQAELQINITVSSSSSIQVSAGQLNQSLCVGYPIEEIVLNLTGATQVEINPDYDWIDLVYSVDSLTVTVSAIAPVVPNEYHFIISTVGGCGQDDVSGVVSVEGLPYIFLSLGNDNQVVCVNQPISDIQYAFNDTSQDEVQVLNLPIGVNYRIEPNMSTIIIFGTPTEVWDGEYTIEVTGCDVVSITGNITVDETCIVAVPGGFSPNNDGQNDFWVVNAIELFPNNTLKVFNRNGTLVFEASPYANDWDGRPNRGYTTVGTGDILPQGVYFYQLSLVPGEPSITGFVYISY